MAYVSCCMPSLSGIALSSNAIMNRNVALSGIFAALRQVVAPGPRQADVGGPTL